MEALAAVVLPSNLVLVIGFLGTGLWLLPRGRRVAPYVLSGALLLLLIVSSGKTAAALFAPLEYAYSKASAPAADSPTAIVVLAAYAADDPNMPLSTRPNSSAMFRIVEAVHLWRACQRCTVIVTGLHPTTKVMAESLASLGVPNAQIRIDSGAINTAGSAANLRNSLGDQPFYLVTSAGHMPRSMGVFLKHGLHPTPAPTDYHVPKNLSQANWSPSSLALQLSDLAMHEHLGLLWYKADRPHLNGPASDLGMTPIQISGGRDGTAIVRSRDALAALASEWDLLADTAGLPTLSHAWVLACAESLYKEEELHIITVRVRGVLAAVAPLVAVDRAGVTRLELIGCSYLFEPSGLLIRLRQRAGRVAAIDRGRAKALRPVANSFANLFATARGRPRCDVREARCRHVGYPDHVSVERVLVTAVVTRSGTT